MSWLCLWINEYTYRVIKSCKWSCYVQEFLYVYIWHRCICRIKFLWNSMKTIQMRAFFNHPHWACCSKGVGYRPLHVFGRESKAGKGVGKLCSEKKEGFRYFLIGGCWLGESWRQATQKQGTLCTWFGQHIWLSLLCPDLEAGGKNCEAVSCWPNPDRSGPIATRGCDLVSWTACHGGCGSVFWVGCRRGCGLASWAYVGLTITHLYIQSLILKVMFLYQRMYAFSILPINSNKRCINLHVY